MNFNGTMVQWAINMLHDVQVCHIYVNELHKNRISLVLCERLLRLRVVKMLW